MDLKHHFHEEGLFSIRVTILGPNLCILEDLVSGEVESFIEDRRGWWEQSLSIIRPWDPSDVDTDIILWLRITGISCHAWGDKLFKVLAEIRGMFIKCDEQTMTRYKMDEARVCIKTGWKEVINDKVKVFIDGVPFIIFMRED